MNGGGAEQKGVEINGVVNLTPNLVLEGSAFLADPQFTETTVLPDDEDPEDQTVVEDGTPLPVSPEQKFWVSAEYTIPNFMGWNGNFWTVWSYSYQSETWKDLDAAIERNADQRIPSWSTSTLQFGFSHDSGWDTALIVRNLFDEQGINYLSDLRTTASSSAIHAIRFIRTLQQPRTISLSFTKKW